LGAVVKTKTLFTLPIAAALVTGVILINIRVNTVLFHTLPKVPKPIPVTFFMDDPCTNIDKSSSSIKIDQR
jgi:hypothetical protein